MQDAAHWLMDQEDLANSEATWQACQERKQRDAADSARKEKEHRKQLLAKYHLQAVGTSAITEAQKARQAPKSKVSTSTQWAAASSSTPECDMVSDAWYTKG